MVSVSLKSIKTWFDRLPDRPPKESSLAAAAVDPDLPWTVGLHYRYQAPIVDGKGNTHNGYLTVYAPRNTESRIVIPVTKNTKPQTDLIKRLIDEIIR